MCWRTVAAVLATLVSPLALAQEVPCTNGSAGAYPCANVDLLARLPLNATPNFSESSSDVWGWTDPETGTEYAIVNQYDHTAFVDLSTPTAPVVLGRLFAPTQAVARDAKTFGDYAFIATDRETAPVQIFDLRRLRGVDDPPVVFEADAEYPLGLGPHNLAVNPASGFAYLVLFSEEACTGGIHIADVREPQAPTFAGCFDPGHSFHDVQCVSYDGPDLDYAGREVCFGSGGGQGSLSIIDVTDKATPTLIAEALYPNPSYAHQGWLTEDRRYFVMNDEGDESAFGINTRTLVLDVEDLDNPDFVFAYDHPTASTDHNVFVRGDFAYQANYESGLRVLDLADIENGTLEEVAFFDTLPGGDEPGFDGAFGVYPYFESGIIVVSDMSRGLFVLRPTFDGSLGVEVPTDTQEPFALSVAPNPFTDMARLTLSAARTERVRVTVYDVFGRPVRHVFDGTARGGGPRELRLDASGLAAGVYFVRAIGETHSATQSVTLTR